MIACPRCGKSIPGWQETCQFCGLILPEELRRWAESLSDEPYYKPVSQGPDPWVPVAYKVVATLWAIQGLVGVGWNLMASMGGAGFFASIAIMMGAVQMILGIGLLLHIEAIRGIVNFVAGINLMLTAAFLVIFLPLTLLMPFGWLRVISDLFTIALCAFVIFLIGETDRVGFR